MTPPPKFMRRPTLTVPPSAAGLEQEAATSLINDGLFTSFVLGFPRKQRARLQVDAKHEPLRYKRPKVPERSTPKH